MKVLSKILEVNINNNLKIKQEDGTEIEVYSVDEVNQKIEAEKKAVVTEYEGKLTESQSTVTKLEADKKAIEDELAKKDPQSANYKTLKDALDKKDAEISTLSGEIAKIKDSRASDITDKLIKTYAQGNDELAKKIKFNYSETLKAVKAETPDEIEQKLQSAVKLSLDIKKPNPLDRVNNGSFLPGVESKQATSNVEFSPQEKALGSKFGISEDDYKKYGSRISGAFKINDEK